MIDLATVLSEMCTSPEVLYNCRITLISSILMFSKFFALGSCLRHGVRYPWRFANCFVGILWSFSCWAFNKAKLWGWMSTQCTVSLIVACFENEGSILFLSGRTFNCTCYDEERTLDCLTLIKLFLLHQDFCLAIPCSHCLLKWQTWNVYSLVTEMLRKLSNITAIYCFVILWIISDWLTPVSSFALLLTAVFLVLFPEL